MSNEELKQKIIEALEGVKENKSLLQIYEIVIRLK